MGQALARGSLNMRSPDKLAAKKDRFRRVAAHVGEYAAILASLGRTLEQILADAEAVDERAFEELRGLHRRMGRARLTSEGINDLSEIGSRLQEIRDEME